MLVYVPLLSSQNRTCRGYTEHIRDVLYTLVHVWISRLCDVLLLPVGKAMIFSFVPIISRVWKIQHKDRYSFATCTLLFATFIKLTQLYTSAAQLNVEIQLLVAAVHIDRPPSKRWTQQTARIIKKSFLPAEIWLSAPPIYGHCGFVYLLCVSAVHCVSSIVLHTKEVAACISFHRDSRTVINNNTTR